MSFHIHRFQPFLGPTKSPLQFSLAETFAENSLLAIGSFLITEVLVRKYIYNLPPCKHGRRQLLLVSTLVPR